MAVLDHFISAKERLGFRLEATPYTAESATEYDILAKNLKVSPSIETYVRKYAVGDFDKFESVQGRRMGTVSFTCDTAGSGTAATPPKLGKVFRACGFRQTIGFAGVEYVLDSNVNATPATIDVVFTGVGENGPVGIRVRLRGCMGDAEIMFTKTGEPLQVNFKFTGVIVSVTNLASASVPGLTGYDTTIPPATLAAALNFRGYPMNVNTMSVKLNNKIEMLTDLAQNEGYEGAYRVDADPTFNMDPYLAKSTDQLLYEIATGETGPATGSFDMWAGSTSVLGNFIRLRGANAQITKSHDVGSREGTEMNPIEGNFIRGTTGAPMLRITFGSQTGIAGY